MGVIVRVTYCSIAVSRFNLSIHFLFQGVPGDAKLVYDVTLKSFERAKEGWQLDGDQKLEQSRSIIVNSLNGLNID